MLVIVRDVWKRWRSGWVLRGVTLSVDRGEGVIVVGSNGSGKTTLLRIIAGLARPSRGEVLIEGRSPWSLESRGIMGYVAHHSMLYPELTVRENLAYFAKIYGVRGYDPENDDVVERLGLKRYMDRKVEELSFGWRRRADIARALLHRPRLLLIDEPFTGLDEQAAKELIELFNDVLVEWRGSIIATSPSMSFAHMLKGFNTYLLREGKLARAHKIEAKH